MGETDSLFPASTLNIRKLAEFFSDGKSCGGLRQSIAKDFSSSTATLEFCELAVIKEMLCTPWMKTFYRDAKKQHSYSEAMIIVKGVLHEFCWCHNV
jgi:hypothetical protein